MTQTKQRYNRDRAYLNEDDIFKEYKNEHNISKSEFKLILKAFFAIFMDEIITKAKIFHLPFKLGRLGVLKSYGDSSLIDFNLFKQGIKTMVKNNHSSNYRVKFLWVTKWPFFLLESNRARVFRYKAPRDATRALAKLLKTEPKQIFKYYDY